MRRFFISEEQARNAETTGTVSLCGSDVNHIAHVLRMRRGDAVMLSATDGTEYTCEIETISDREVCCRVRDAKKNGTEPVARVILIQGLPKGEKTDWIVQKGVELGASELRFTVMERTVVRFASEKGGEKKTGRWQRIAEEAAKQCGRGTVPAVTLQKDFAHAIADLPADSVRLIAYENEEEQSLKQVLSQLQKEKSRTIAVIIGPEGGIAPGEYEDAVRSGFSSVSLGKRILRTETAGMAVLSAIRYEFED